MVLQPQSIAYRMFVTEDGLHGVICCIITSFDDGIYCAGVGWTVKSPEDTYDQNYGMMLAASRAWADAVLTQSTDIGTGNDAKPSDCPCLESDYTKVMNKAEKRYINDVTSKEVPEN